MPSSLHQKVKFPYEGAIVTLQGDYELKLAGVPICEIQPESAAIPLSGFDYVQCIEKELNKSSRHYSSIKQYIPYTFYPSSDPAVADKSFGDRYFTEGPNPQSLTSWYHSIQDLYGSLKEEDWAENLDAGAMTEMFQDMILTVEDSTIEELQGSSISHATVPFLNWYLECGVIAEIHEEEDLGLPDSSL